ncbi:MAG TPA: hypothetical protein PLE43_01660, partial [Alphaproteobacteria bacterium]|nr:hypothetical protein [Alphaproteobacteria bacterium]
LYENFLLQNTFNCRGDYQGTVDEIRRLANIHHELVEKFAEDLSNFCLKDPRVSNVEVSIEKLDVYPEGRVGTQIIRTK